MALARPVFVVAAKRTAFGTFGGKLRDISATVLGVHSSKAAIEAASVDPAAIDSVIFGNVMQVGSPFGIIYALLLNNLSLIFNI